MHGMQSAAALVRQNGILQNRFSGAAIQCDSVHGMQLEAALVMHTGILHDRFTTKGNGLFMIFKIVMTPALRMITPALFSYAVAGPNKRLRCVDVGARHATCHC